MGRGRRVREGGGGAGGRVGGFVVGGAKSCHGAQLLAVPAQAGLGEGWSGGWEREGRGRGMRECQRPGSGLQLPAGQHTQQTNKNRPTRLRTTPTAPAQAS